jgi:electron transfer flavoprotein alpha subunit
MADQVFCYILHKDGKADDSALELAIAAGKLAPGAEVTAIVAGSGVGLDAACNEVAAAYSAVWKIDHEELAYVSAEVLRPLLVSLLPAGSILLIAHEHFGMDLAPGLSVKLGAAYLPDVVAFEAVDGGVLNAIREEYSGMVSTHVSCDLSRGAVISVRPGAFQVAEAPAGGGAVVDKTGEATAGGLQPAGRRYLETVVAEVGDVDITKEDVLVSVGRGIEDEENIEIAQELADAMGAVVSCSRPIVDAKWLEKSRQVGTSGQTVKPKVYMALGISGSFQHLGGLKGSPFILAVNKNPKAPIFQVADVGVVGDILDFIPALTEKIQEG